MCQKTGGTRRFSAGMADPLADSPSTIPPTLFSEIIPARL